MAPFSRLAMACLAAVFLAAIIASTLADPTECRLMWHTTFGSVPYTQCPTVNCSDELPCVVDYATLNGVTYKTCLCGTGGFSAQACQTFYDYEHATVICASNWGCTPATYVCREGTLSDVWTPVCDCQPPEPI